MVSTKNRSCPTYALIIVNYCSASATINLIKSWLKHHPLSTQFSYEIIIWNNNPLLHPENLLFKRLQRHFPSSIPLTVASTHRNLGFGGGVNAAAKLTSATYLFILNPDLTLTQNLATPLIKLHRQLSNQKSNQTPPGFLAPQLFTFDRQPQPYAYGHFPTLFSTLFHTAKFYPPVIDCHSSIYPLDWLSGACLFISANTFHQLHGFNPDFFLYFEDIDFCRRLHLAGYQNYLCPQLSIIHTSGYSFTSIHSSSSSSSCSTISPPLSLQLSAYAKSQLLYFRLHYPTWQSRLIAFLQKIYYRHSR